MHTFDKFDRRLTLGQRHTMASRPAPKADPNETTVRVLDSDMRWRGRKLDEASEEGVQVSEKVPLVLAVMVRCPCAAIPPHRTYLTVSRVRAQCARKKGAPSNAKKVRISDLIIKRGLYLTAASHFGTVWFEEQCNDDKHVNFNGDLITALDHKADADRVKTRMPNLTSWDGLYETLRSTLENGTLDPKHLGKGSTYGCPYPDGVEVDEVASRLYGA